MTLRATGATPQEATNHLMHFSAAAKTQPTADNICLDDDRQQIYGGTRQVRDARVTLSATPAVNTAKDSGVHHDGYLQRQPVLYGKLEKSPPPPCGFPSYLLRIPGAPHSRVKFRTGAASTDVTAIISRSGTVSKGGNACSLVWASLAANATEPCLLV